ncbi:MAG TPA: HD domain-containing phosphohydrolase [Thermoanaerobaculia bacterium]|jgi:putative two-component system response regulator|nr:HD domain-containing phosphohydrolase [Thermoanaerobaculia bacterium]
MNRRPHILIADDVAANCEILAGCLRSLDCQIDTAANGREALAKLSPETDLLLLDQLMPEIDGLGVLHRLRSDAAFSDLPVIMVTARETREDRLRAVESGVSDFIAKPVDRAEVLVRVKAQLRLKAAQDEIKRSRLELEATVASRTADLRLALADMKAAQSRTREAHVDTIRRLVLAAELKDRDTSEHIVRISRYWAVLGRAIGLSAAEVEIGSQAATMHDVGKIGIPDPILRKRGPLTASERRVMQTHTLIGARILAGSPSELMQAGETIAISHHEKWDGSGYPRHLAGETIPLWGRICAVVDVFDALTSRRPYRRALDPAEAVEVMRPDRGRHFDPHLFDVFVDHLDEILSTKSETRADAQPGPILPPHLLRPRRERRPLDQRLACR